MRWIIIALCLFLAVSSTHAAPIKTATYELGAVTDAHFGWMKSKFNMIVNSDYAITDPATFNGFTGELWTTYLDITTLATLTQYLDMYDWALASGVNPEEMLLHAKVDFTASIGTAWQYIDKFDSFEGAKGVMRTADDVSYTDLTATAYSGAATWQDTVYVGYQEPFDQINLTITTAGVGISRVWEFWNGSSWTSLTVTDGTSSFATSGQVSFVPPSNWARKVVNGSRNKYFVRCRITGATTAPVTSSVKSDDWVRGAANLCVGWDATSGTIVNSGELAYNPTPPAGSSAKFRYQARVPTWSVNHFIFNIADFQPMGGTSTRTVAAYLAQSTINSVTAIPYSGMMYDDGIYPATFGSLGISSTDFADKTANNVTVEGLARYQDIYTRVKAAMPTLKVGLNSYRKDYVKVGDFNLYEYFNYVTSTGDTDNTKFATTDNATNMCYDDYLSSNNPSRPLKGMMIYQDGSATTYNGGYTWDQANRGPIAALSKHLIGANDNTLFAYFTNGGAYYSERDDFIFMDTHTTALSSPLTADTSGSTKTIPVGDSSQFSNLAECLVIGDGANRDVIRAAYTKPNSTSVATAGKIYFPHSAGETVRFCQRGHFLTDTVPPIDRMVRWANWFPAMGVDFGTPGTRNLAWVTGVSQGWTNLTGYGSAVNTNVWGRDYTNALVLHRPNGGSSSVVDYGTYSAPLPLGGTYYPLYADGTLGAAITSIALRRGEGAILMKAPPAPNTTHFRALKGTWR